MRLYTKNNHTSLFNQENAPKKPLINFNIQVQIVEGGFGLCITKITSISLIVVTNAQRGYYISYYSNSTLTLFEFHSSYLRLNDLITKKMTRLNCFWEYIPITNPK